MAIGSHANTVVAVVMKIGLRRWRPPITIASVLGIPSTRSWLIRSIRTIPFLTTTPIRMTLPIVAV